MKTAVTLFSGGGCAALGLRQAGYQIVGAVEYDPQIAACYALNIGPVEIVDLAKAVARFFARWRNVDLLQVSPPCPNFSSAKTGGYETALDYRLAGAVCRALRVMLPGTFILENVRGYVHSASYARIRHTLTALGYQMRTRVMMAADYGVPQTRERLILIATRGGIAARFPRQTHSAGGGLGMEPWIGWYAAIEDLIPTLPASQFAPWQLPYVQKYLEAYGCAAALVEGSGAGHFDTAGPQLIGPDVPAWTIRASHRGDTMRAFVINSDNTGSGGTMWRPHSAPAKTVTATIKMPRALLLDGQESNTPRYAESPAFSVPASVAKGTPRAFLASRQTANRGDGVPHAVAPAYSLTNHPASQWRAWLEAGRVVQLIPRALARFQTIPDWYILPDKAALACRIIGNGVPCWLIEQIARQLIGAERIAA